MFYRLLRSILFQFEPESIHRFAMGGLDFILGSESFRRKVSEVIAPIDPALRTTLFGVEFENPIGLAAGFDKNAQHINPLAALGFGHVEIGTVTAHAQSGNPQPRMFRLPTDRALLNRMGFNNDGSEAVAARLHPLRPETVLGVNIGKSKITPLEDAAQDYLTSFERLHPYARYMVVNVSSPNTPGLRSLQDRGPLSEIFETLQEANRDLLEPKPLLVKIAPDLTIDAIDEVLDVVMQHDLAGIIATNTTISRAELRTANVDGFGNGGISGHPVHARAKEVVSHIYRETQGELPIIGVGGVFNSNDALDLIFSGASLVQIWTGFVYEGPFVVSRINSGLRGAIERHGWNSIQDAVGLGVT